MKDLVDSGGEETAVCVCCTGGSVPCIQQLIDRAFFLVLQILTGTIVILELIR